VDLGAGDRSWMRRGAAPHDAMKRPSENELLTLCGSLPVGHAATPATWPLAQAHWKL